MGLLEAVFSILISAVGLLALAQLFGVAAALNSTSHRTTLMARAAQESIEVIRSKSFSAVAAGTASTVYKNRYNVSTVVEDTGAELKKITVTVSDRNTTTNASGSRTSVFVVYWHDEQATAGPLYNRLAEASSDENSGGSTPEPTPTPTPTATPTPLPTPTATPIPRYCAKGEATSQTGCVCQSPMKVVGNGECK